MLHKHYSKYVGTFLIIKFIINVFRRSFKVFFFFNFWHSHKKSHLWDIPALNVFSWILCYKSLSLYVKKWYFFNINLMLSILNYFSFFTLCFLLEHGFVLVAWVQQNESVIHIHIIYSLFLRLFSLTGHYRILSRFSCAIHCVCCA